VSSKVSRYNKYAQRRKTQVLRELRDLDRNRIRPKDKSKEGGTSPVVR